MQTLVLSPDWNPMDQISWERALTLEYQEKVEVLERYESWEIHTVSLTMQVPAVVRVLTDAFGWRKRGVRFSRESIYLRDKGCCCYCLNAVTRAEFTYDHVVPKALGGTTNWTNIVVCCHKCNQKKSNRTLAECGLRLHSLPVKPKSLPETMRISLPGGVIPEKWKAYVRSDLYWNAELLP